MYAKRPPTPPTRLHLPGHDKHNNNDHNNNNNVNNNNDDKNKNKKYK